MTTGKKKVAVNSIVLQSKEEGPPQFSKVKYAWEFICYNLGIVIP